MLGRGMYTNYFEIKIDRIVSLECRYFSKIRSLFFFSINFHSSSLLFDFYRRLFARYVLLAILQLTVFYRVNNDEDKKKSGEFF
jgi:hypothetical protein